MGRLAGSFTRRSKVFFRNRKRFFKISLALVTILVGVGAYLLLNNRSIEPSAEDLKHYISSGQKIIARAQTQNEYQQIYYRFDDRDIYLTSEPINHTNPVTSGQYISWEEANANGGRNIVLYDIITKERLQLSYFGRNRNVHMDNNRLVWEQGQGDTWVIRFFDGKDLFTVSRPGKNALNPYLQGKQIAYAEEASEGLWQAFVYDTDSKSSEAVGEATSHVIWPRFIGEEIKTDLGPPPGR